MASYSYCSALPAPENWAGIDFAQPCLANSIAAMVTGIRREVETLLPPAGVTLRTQGLESFDGAKISCFILEPEGVTKTVPGMLYCHGGGFFLPIQPMMVQLAAQYAKALGIRVFVPEYRIWPDYRNPYPFRDCLSTWHWMTQTAAAQKLNAKKILLYGESVGGTLAAGLALFLQNQPTQNAIGQVLIYPALDNRCSRYPSMRTYSEAAWPLRMHVSMWQQYLQAEWPKQEPFIIPMKAENLAGLPQTYIKAAQIDILHDEAVAYAKRLRETGVPVQYQEIKGGYHGFDAHPDNAFVQAVLVQRIHAMQQML